jgi:electron transfer flavoprotein alpha subunit
MRSDSNCTSLEIGEHYEKKTDTHILRCSIKIRPAFGGNIIATIINPDTRPQMATVREGVMKKEITDPNYRGEIRMLDTATIIHPEVSRDRDH